MKNFKWLLRVILPILLLVGSLNCFAKDSLSQSHTETIDALETVISQSFTGSYFDGRDFIVYQSLGELSNESMKTLHSESIKDMFRKNFISSFLESADEYWADRVIELFKTTQYGIIFILSNQEKEVIVLRVDGRDF